MSVLPYPRYRDSGVPWVGDVPWDWAVAPIKRSCREITDGAHISPQTDGGVYDFISTKDIRDSGIDFAGSLKTSPETYEYMVRTGCKPTRGDILFSKDGTVGRTALVAEEREFVVASSLIILRPDPGAVLPVYLHWLLQSSLVVGQVECFVKGAGLPRLSIQNLLKVWGVFPPKREQASIARFLQQECDKIDALVGEQERLIALLKEKRQAVISQAVTKGLDPNAPMKNSGVEWLGSGPVRGLRDRPGL